jgi:hypothetical protein
LNQYFTYKHYNKIEKRHCTKKKKSGINWIEYVVAIITVSKHLAVITAAAYLIQPPLLSSFFIVKKFIYFVKLFFTSELLNQIQ